MKNKRIILNIFLILLAIIMGGVAVWILRLPPLVLSEKQTESLKRDTIVTKDIIVVHDTLASENILEVKNREVRKVASSFEDADLTKMTLSHPFGKEAKNVLSGRLEISDSLSRRKILSYCEHLRTAYTTKDLDFIRQVFSDDALIIVGHTVKTDNSNKSVSIVPSNVSYSIRSKQQYLEKLAEVFKSNKSIGMEFSDFSLMRHPTIEGIYGVTIHQKYKSDRYSDDGYLFLLWDFRNRSMPLIHVRTWQPSNAIAGDTEIIDIGDFNLE